MSGEHVRRSLSIGHTSPASNVAQGDFPGHRQRREDPLPRCETRGPRHPVEGDNEQAVEVSGGLVRCYPPPTVPPQSCRSVENGLVLKGLKDWLINSLRARWVSLCVANELCRKSSHSSVLKKLSATALFQQPPCGSCSCGTQRTAAAGRDVERVDALIDGNMVGLNNRHRH